jgi:molybdopterin-guanine dinucleotide biosynthesis protein B
MIFVSTRIEFASSSFNMILTGILGSIGLIKNDIMSGRGCKSMKIVAIIGESDSGKTSLIRRLIPELRKRGYSAAVIKHCAHGFDLDVKGKDSWQMMKAGAEGVGMVAPDRLAVLRKTRDAEKFAHLAAKYFRDADIVIVEGGYGVKGLKTIEVLPKGKPVKVQSDRKDLIAVVSSSKVDVECPVYRPGQIAEIADLLVSELPALQMSVSLEVDGRPVLLNAFVQKTFQNVVVALVESLHGIASSPDQITLSVTRTKSRQRKR